MSSISPIASVPYMTLAVAIADAGIETEASVLAAILAPRADTRRPALANETAAALLGEQAVKDEEPGPRIDLSGRDLRTTDLKPLNLKGADLRGADLSGMDLSSLDLSGADLSDAKLAGAILTNAKLTNVSAPRVDLSGAMLRNTVMNGGDFTGATFRGAYLGGFTPEQDDLGTNLMVAKDARFDGANFRNASLRGVVFANVLANGADFSGTLLDAAFFKGTSLREASFDQASGRLVTFRDSDVSGTAMTNMAVRGKLYENTILDDASFAGSSFSRSGFILTDLTKANLARVVRQAQFATFCLTNMSNVDFSGFEFFGAHFNDAPAGSGATKLVTGAGASYVGTNFSGADFDHVSFFQEGDLSDADFSGARFNRTVIDNRAGSALAGLAGVIDSDGGGIPMAERQALREMSAGLRPIERGFRMPDPPGPGGDGVDGGNPPNPADGVAIARLPAEAVRGGVVPLAAPPPPDDAPIAPSTDASPNGEAADAASTMEGASATHKSLRTANRSLRADVATTTHWELSLIKLFTAFDPDAER